MRLVWAFRSQAAVPMHSLPPSLFLCSIQKPVSSSRPTAFDVVARRRCQGRPLRRRFARTIASRPRLDSVEHADAVAWSGQLFEGSSQSGRENCAATLYPVGRMTQTMMHACASAAKLRGGGPILNDGIEAVDKGGAPPPRTVVATVTLKRSSAKGFEAIDPFLTAALKPGARAGSAASN